MNATMRGEQIFPLRLKGFIFVLSGSFIIPFGGEV